jgi:hypothetical protein
MQMVERSKVMAGVAAAVALTAAPALAAPNPSQILNAGSYAELLQPVPDAQAKLAALDSQPAPARRTAAQGEQVAQYYYHDHHHHHHHHHWRGYDYGPPFWRYRYYHHHHHHHHHHHYYYYDGE